jgi:membrane protein implicated in regulation of membrane protease activity
MAWFIFAAIVVVIALLVWRYDRRTRRSGSDNGARDSAQTRARVWGGMGGGRDVKYRDQRY